MLERIVQSPESHQDSLTCGTSNAQLLRLQALLESDQAIVVPVLNEQELLVVETAFTRAVAAGLPTFWTRLSEVWSGPPTSFKPNSIVNELQAVIERDLKMIPGCKHILASAINAAELSFLEHYNQIAYLFENNLPPVVDSISLRNGLTIEVAGRPFASRHSQGVLPGITKILHTHHDPYLSRRFINGTPRLVVELVLSVAALGPGTIYFNVEDHKKRSPFSTEDMVAQKLLPAITLGREYEDRFSGYRADTPKSSALFIPPLNWHRAPSHLMDLPEDKFQRIFAGKSGEQIAMILSGRSPGPFSSMDPSLYLPKENRLHITSQILLYLNPDRLK